MCGSVLFILNINLIDFGKSAQMIFLKLSDIAKEEGEKNSI